MWLWVLGIAAAHEVVVFGDSWAEGSGDELGAVIAGHGRADLSVDNRGVGGTTAMYWNDSAPTALADAVSANPDARWVWLSILGNDTFAHYAASEGQLAASRNEAELRELLDGLFAVHPDVQVAIFSYDYVNFELNAQCVLSAILYFPQLYAAGQLTTYEVNRIFERDVGEVQARVAADYPQVSHFTFWGALQADAGTVGAPNPLLPSPGSRMADCIHPTSAGYTVMHERLWDAYWDRSQPTAALTGPTEACVGEEAVFIDSSLGTDARRWTVDGAELGSEQVLRWPVQEGPQQVRLWVANGAWSDTELVTLTGVATAAPEVSGDQQICAGQSVTLSASVPVRWSPAASLDDADARRPVATPAETTTYVAASEGDCGGEAEVTVWVLPAPEIGALSGPERLAVEEVGRFEVEVPLGATVAWQGEGVVEAEGAAASVRWDQAGSYELVAVVTSEGGCEAEARWQVVVGDGGGGGAEEEQAAAGCGCAGGGPVVGWGLLAGLAWRRRRAR
jgi:uncharacterized protein (TIGR03382 family)